LKGVEDDIDHGESVREINLHFNILCLTYRAYIHCTL